MFQAAAVEDELPPFQKKDLLTVGLSRRLVLVFHLPQGASWATSAVVLDFGQARRNDLKVKKG